MRNIIISRCVLIVSITIILVSLETEGGLKVTIETGKNHSIIKDIKDSAIKARDHVTSVVADLVFQMNGISKLSQKKPIKRTHTRDAINQEPGFSLTKEEMDKFKIWDNGIIPFFIDEYSFDKVLRDRIRLILDHVNAATGVQFMEIPSPPVDEKERYILFINRRGVLRCVDHTTNDFTNQGVQRVVLGYDCIDLNTGLGGVILTLLGVPPQHNAPNRDDYIEVMNNNILPDKVSYFTKLQNSDWLFHDLEYDFESASHYPYYMYSAYGASTIRPKAHVDESSTVGENKALSMNDILKIKMLYSYIIKKPTHRMHAACSHMFQPGKALLLPQRDKHNIPVQPRKKPTTYTGYDPFENWTDNDPFKNHDKHDTDDDTYTDDTSEHEGLDPKHDHHKDNKF